jgi:hypothetical protein
METDTSRSPGMIRVPTSSGWPLVAAFGLTLLLAGLLTHWLVSVLGLAALIAGLFGWFREVLPWEAEEAVAVDAERVVVASPATAVHRLDVGETFHRARLPLEIYPYSAGIRGGLVGGAAMAIVALLYGLVGHKSLWYPINLLAAAGSAQISSLSYEQLLAFNGFAFGLGCVLHLIGSVLIGLLYGIALPMFPRHPILFGGVLAPVFWSGIFHAGLDIINPALNARIDWPWFMASQFAFGLVAGFVVARHERIRTLQHLPFAVRAGIEAPGLIEKRDGDERP